MINGRPRPNIDQAVVVKSLDRIVRTLNKLPLDTAGQNVILFSDGVHAVLVDTSGYDYPRYKTPKIVCSFYSQISDNLLEGMLKSKATGDETDFIVADYEEVRRLNSR